jgi:hypothetical protein
MFQDGLKHPFGIRQNIVVPETQYPEPLAFQPLVSNLVLFSLVSVLAAVQFDDKPTRQTGKIHGIGS